MNFLNKQQGKKSEKNEIKKLIKLFYKLFLIILN